MTEIRVDELTPQDLRDFYFIEAVPEDRASRIRVWDSRRMLSFVSASHPGTEVKTLLVGVASADECGLEPLMAKIEQLGGGKGLIRAPGR
jgi:hypothetical protein